MRLSMTGGCALLAKNFRRGTLGEIEIPTASGNIRALIEFLNGRGSGKGSHSELGFRFIGLDDADHERLGRTLRRTG